MTSTSSELCDLCPSLVARFRQRYRSRFRRPPYALRWADRWLVLIGALPAAPCRTWGSRLGERVWGGRLANTGLFKVREVPQVALEPDFRDVGIHVLLLTRLAEQTRPSERVSNGPQPGT